jgi:HaeII restriction endonuclease
MLTGIREPGACVSLTAALYRVGVTNAADRGLDMWSNFGTAVQVKHLTLDAELAECIAEGIMAEGVVIVCRDAEKAAIDAILEQVGWGQRIRGIVTLSDLEGWYALCLGPKHRAVLAGSRFRPLRGTRERRPAVPHSRAAVWRVPAGERPSRPAGGRQTTASASAPSNRSSPRSA